MTADFKSAIAAFAVLLLACSSSAAPEDLSGEGDNDPRIDPEEIIAPEMDSRDPAWKPAYERHEDPASLVCGRRPACEAYKDNKTREAEAQ